MRSHPQCTDERRRSRRPSASRLTDDADRLSEPLAPVARTVGFLSFAAAGDATASTLRLASDLATRDAVALTGLTLAALGVLLWWLQRYLPDDTPSLWFGLQLTVMLMVVALRV